MTTAAELLEKLEETISRPAASSLREYVLRDDRTNALQIFQGERFDLKEAEAMYDYCRKLWGGVDVDLVEIPLANASETLAALAEAAGADERNQPRYLLRDGLQVSSSGAYFDRGEWRLFLAEGGFVSLSRIRQLWHIRPAAVALPSTSSRPM